MNTVASLILLAILITLCVIGLVHPLFNDNLGQCIGMVVILLWAVVMVDRILTVKYAALEPMLLCTGIIFYGLGVSVRTYLYKRKRG